MYDSQCDAAQCSPGTAFNSQQAHASFFDTAPDRNQRHELQMINVSPRVRVMSSSCSGCANARLPSVRLSSGPGKQWVRGAAGAEAQTQCKRVNNLCICALGLCSQVGTWAFRTEVGSTCCRLVSLRKETLRDITVKASGVPRGRKQFVGICRDRGKCV